MDANKNNFAVMSLEENTDQEYEEKLLQQAVYEWIRRMTAYSNFYLTNSIIQSIAAQFRLVLNMPWFCASTEWVEKFRTSYKLITSNTKHMGIAYTEKKSVQVQDIVRELMHADRIPVIKEEIDFEKELPSSVVPNYKHKTQNGNTPLDTATKTTRNKQAMTPKKCCQQILPKSSARLGLASETSNSPENEKQTKLNEKTDGGVPAPIVIEIMSIPSTVTVRKVQSTTPAPVNNKTLNIPSTVTIKKLQSSASTAKQTRFARRKPLKSRDEALKCLKMMEEFALMKEHFRLIGFIERLEKLIKKSH